jgi:phospholipid/cholesterol/gamma-HCH transport system ATP-binding protein
MQRKSIETIRVENMSFAYEGASPLFTNVTLDLPTDRAVWIRSSGGHGKSTFLRLLAGLATPQTGGLYFNAKSVSEMSFEEFLPYRLNIGYGFDFGGLLNNKTIKENLILPLLYHEFLPPEEANQRVDEIIEYFAISQAANLRPFAVSGSVRKLACVLRAFVHWPQVVLLDDPMTGLKEDHLFDLFQFIDESFATRGLKQMYFTGENSAISDRFGGTELMISSNWFTVRAAA